ncbi:Cytidine deaminase [Clostridiaceae bacterium JG1575]|nr:Cytidine deaminase [Clostridiaceae bacterium JG1575]
MTIKREELIAKALESRHNAYAPYSHFFVGAAVQTEEGEVVGGFNIENASFGATNCAERTAIFSALNQGARRIVALAVAGDPEHFTYPCGICRQVMAEFAGQDMPVFIVKSALDYREETLAALLPGAFTPKDLEEYKDV